VTFGYLTLGLHGSYRYSLTLTAAGPAGRVDVRAAVAALNYDPKPWNNRATVRIDLT